MALLARQRGDARLHRRRVKLAAQAVAAAGVAALLGVLVWRVVRDDGPRLPAVVRPAHPVPAPNFTLPRLDGSGDIRLSSLRGKAVVLNFFASYCVPCEAESPVLEETWRRNRSRGLVVLGVDIEDTASAARAFVRRHRLTYPLAHDGPGKLIDPYGILGIPQTVFVDRRGRVVTSPIRGGVHLDKNRQAFREGLELALRQ